MNSIQSIRHETFGEWLVNAPSDLDEGFAAIFKEIDSEGDAKKKFEVLTEVNNVWWGL